MDVLIGMIWLAGGLLLGASVTWLVMRARYQYASAGIQATYQSELARCEERLLRIPELETELHSKEHELREAQTEYVKLRSYISQLEARMEAERRATEEKLQLLQSAQLTFQDSFKALSADALKHNNQSFLELATQNLAKFQEGARNELEKREKAVDALVKPIRESLEKVDAKIEGIEKIRTSAYAGISEQIKLMSESHQALRGETANLVKALRTPNVRGRWGEIQLKRVVEMAGMVEYCDFLQQETIESDDWKLRPDMVVRLPSNRKIIVDSKAPLHAYLEAIDAQNEDERLLRLKAHAQQVRTHVSQLAAKTYWEKYQPGLDFVILFLPGEVFYNAALECDPELIEFGVDRKVLIATPTSLIGLLRVVAYGWRQETLAENARHISQLGAELYDRIRTLTEHFASVKKGLDSATDAYNRAVGSFEGRVLVSARKFKELSASTKEDIPTLQPIEKLTRAIEVEVVNPDVALPDISVSSNLDEKTSE